MVSPPTPMITTYGRWTSGTLVRANNRAVYYLEPWGEQRWRFDLDR